MTKQEIFRDVVRLSAKLKKTGMPQRVCWALAEGNSDTIDTLFEAFPMYYHGLYSQIEVFGQMFNDFIGNSEEDIEKSIEVLDDCAYMMCQLANNGIISRIADADSAGDTEKVLEIIKEFNEENAFLVGNLISFQRAFTQYSSKLKTGKEGEIFGLKVDSEKEIYEFNPKVIDAMSLYIFAAIAGIPITRLFYVERDTSALDVFEDAIGNSTNANFAHFATYGDLFHPEYPSIGCLLVDAYNTRLEE